MVAARQRRPARCQQRVEALQVELAVGDPQRIPVPARDQAAIAERLAQTGDKVVQAAPGAGRRRLAPQRVDQAIVVERLVRVHQQHGEQEALSTLGQRHHP